MHELKAKAIYVLRERGAHRILDVATGTGFHSVRLLQAGFEVVSADGSPVMLAKAFFANARRKELILQTVHADWRWLNRDVHEKFDAIICLGNSFTHFILILDQRNYDEMLDSGFYSKHTYYYCGINVKAEPEHVDEGLARFRYEFPDKSVFHLNMYPLRKDYVRTLMKEVGFQSIATYGYFQETYRQDEPDFFIHVAEKQPVLTTIATMRITSMPLSGAVNTFTSVFMKKQTIRFLRPVIARFKKLLLYSL